jgi:hypothetical protein
LKVSHIWTIPHGHKPRSLQVTEVFIFVSRLRNNNSKRDCDLNLDAFYSVFYKIIKYGRMTRHLRYFVVVVAGLRLDLNLDLAFDLDLRWPRRFGVSVCQAVETQRESDRPGLLHVGAY